MSIYEALVPVRPFNLDPKVYTCVGPALRSALISTSSGTSSVVVSWTGSSASKSISSSSSSESGSGLEALVRACWRSDVRHALLPEGGWRMRGGQCWFNTALQHPKKLSTG